MKKALFALTAFLFAGFLLQSCKKDNDTADTTSMQTTAEDLVSYNDLSEYTDYEIDALVDDAFASDEVSDRGACPTVTFAQPKGTWPNTITLDYSTDGCTKDGNTFKGRIVIEQSNKMTVAGAVRNVSFNDFYINNVKIEGTRTLTNDGPNTAGQPVWSKTADETFIFPDGTTATFSTNRTRTLVNGADTPTHLDNVWSIAGSTTGTNRKGETFTSTITSPLMKRFLCPWVVEGVIEFAHDGKMRTLDFGDGTCDRDAVLTLNDGTTKNIKIRHHWWK
jgi:hypothetical protein